MELQTIHATPREQDGKGGARKLRRTGQIPAVAYGGGAGGQTLSLDPKEIELLHRGKLGWNQPVIIEVDGGDSVPLAILKDVQKHPITGKLLHVDFLRVAKGQSVVVRIPVRAEGRAVGAETGGKLSQPVRELVVSCQPEAIPEAITVDVTPLEVGDKIALFDIELPAGLQPLSTTNLTLVTVTGRGAGDDLPEDEVEGAEGEEDGEGAEEGADEGGDE